jgi:membrane associated rhomboid family serine protease
VGIYDREYYRQERPKFPSFVPQTVVGAIIAVNVIIWVADFFTLETSTNLHGEVVGHWLSDTLGTHVYTLTHPLYWWQFLTAGFAHSPNGVGHILGNMFVLFFLGQDVEETYGSKEFLKLYLALVIFASLSWNVVNMLTGADPMATMYGASGAIAGIVVLYALNFPHRTILLFFVIPMPAWLFGVLAIVLDLSGALGGYGAEEHIAYAAHLSGAAFALLYFQLGWRISRWTSFSWMRMPFRPKPHLRVHHPQEETDIDFSREVDRILEKIYREGEASLTLDERHTLETASRKYQRRGKS